jgi:hypothetical protein
MVGPTIHVREGYAFMYSSGLLNNFRAYVLMKGCDPWYNSSIMKGCATKNFNWVAYWAQPKKKKKKS